ncbi:hypothetical protein WJX75_004441 [Coccomyxa subellipsoidea]|uniref:Uncharacterized protein n=1 Tax=Coccomyxa subellipsoidea TaxID=248742 RepID=A0ABR2YVY9_9CHLO
MENSCAPESLTAVNPYDCFSAEELLMRLLQKGVFPWTLRIEACRQLLDCFWHELLDAERTAPAITWAVFL